MEGGSRDTGEDGNLDYRETGNGVKDGGRLLTIHLRGNSTNFSPSRPVAGGILKLSLGESRCRKHSKPLMSAEHRSAMIQRFILSSLTFH